MIENKIIAYKGFDANLCCGKFQYEIGKEYFQEGEILCRKNGFHACANPLDVLYESRRPLYEAFADHQVDSNGNPDDTVEQIIRLWEENA